MYSRSTGWSALACACACALLGSALACSVSSQPDSRPLARDGLSLTVPNTLAAPIPAAAARAEGLYRSLRGELDPAPSVAPGNASRAGKRAEGTAAEAAATDRLETAPRPRAEAAESRTRSSYHVFLGDQRHPGAGVELHIEDCPQQPRIELAWTRSMRYGAALTVADADVERIAGRPWQRLRFSYTRRPAGAESPSIHGIEYAAVGGGRLYRVTIVGAAARADALAAAIAPTLRIPARERCAPVVSADLAAAADAADAVPAAVARARADAVLVVAADWRSDAGERARLVPAALGSGLRWDARGSVLTSLHVVLDEARGAPHDAFVLGRSHTPPGSAAPVLQFECAGHIPARALAAASHPPSQSDTGAAALAPLRDQARIRCAWDLDGRPWPADELPASRADALPLERVARPADRDADADAQVWLLGYARADDGLSSARSGRLLGPAPPSPWPPGAVAAPADLLAVDIAVEPGLSGGAVVDEHGRLLGTVFGYRERLQQRAGTLAATARIGLLVPTQRPTLSTHHADDSAKPAAAARARP